MTRRAPSEIGETFRQFVDWARGRGWRYASAPIQLAHFERFLERRNVQSLTEIDAALLGEYQRALSITRSTRTVNGYMSTLRALWRYLQCQELVVEDATGELGRLRPDYFTPHLYSAHELLRIERGVCAAIERARSSKHRLTCRMRRTAFGLLRDCGLRVSEACRLNVADYDRRARTLRIEHTKFFKTRVIPLPRSTCASLERYLAYRQGVATDTPSLFVSMFRRRLQRGALESPFKQLLCEIGLYRSRRRRGRTVFGSTNLHALRHSYAVRTLERWQRQGCDVERLLPLLSSYMGHVKVTYTAHYLHLTPVLRQIASERFGNMVLSQLDGSRLRIDEAGIDNNE
ncbi:MAG: tyrosine-type recombinase/integrase [Myxococcota bacterium]